MAELFIQNQELIKQNEELKELNMVVMMMLFETIFSMV